MVIYLSLVPAKWWMIGYLLFAIRVGFRNGREVIVRSEQSGG